MGQHAPMEFGNETSSSLGDEPGLVQGTWFGISARPHARFLSVLMGPVTDRGAIYLAGTYRSVGKG